MNTSLEHLEPKSGASDPFFSAPRGTILADSDPAKHAAFVAKNRLSSSEIESRRQQMKQMYAEFEAMDRK